MVHKAGAWDSEVFVTGSILRWRQHSRPIARDRGSLGFGRNDSVRDAERLRAGFIGNYRATIERL